MAKEMIVPSSDRNHFPGWKEVFRNSRYCILRPSPEPENEDLDTGQLFEELNWFFEDAV